MIVIIGAGLAGLTCAKELVTAGEHVLVLEAADQIGDEYAQTYTMMAIVWIAVFRYYLPPILPFYVISMLMR